MPIKRRLRCPDNDCPDAEKKNVFEFDVVEVMPGVTPDVAYRCSTCGYRLQEVQAEQAPTAGPGGGTEDAA